MSNNPENKKPFYKRPLGCLLTLVGGLFLFAILGTIIAIWAAGKFTPGIAAGVVKDKAGATLTTGENDNNLFAGRVDLKDIKLTNPSRFREQRCLELNEIKAQVELGSLLSDRKIIPEIILDIKGFTFVAKGTNPLKYGSDNNIIDFKNAFASEKTKEKTDAPEQKPEPAGKPVHFKIGKLVLKLDQVRAVAEDVSADPIFDKSKLLALEFTDITDENIKEKVYDKVAQILKQNGFNYDLSGMLDGIIGQAQAELDKAKQALEKKADEAINKATDKANEAVNKATEKAGAAVDKAADKVGNALGGLLSGGKKEEKK